MSFITDKIAWRYVVPRRRYWSSLKTARLCPEIRGEINRLALISLLHVPVMPAMLIGAVPMLLGYGLIAVGSALLGRLPDIAEMKGQAIEAAWKKVPLEEIQRRRGDYVPTIISRKPA